MQTANTKQLESQQQIITTQSSGIDAIFSHNSFSNKASSMYYYAVRSYLDINHSSMIQECINQSDLNFLYSVNCSALWLLLKDKIKRLNKMHIFQNLSDKITVKYILTFASYMSLNEAKQKVIEKEREALRKDVKEYLLNKLKKQVNRKASMLQQFSKSSLFNKICQQLNLKNDEKQQLRQILINFKFTRTPSLVSFLQRCLNYIQKSIQKKQSQGRQQNLRSSNRAQANTRQTYIILLLLSDWIKIILNNKEKKLTKLMFSHITDKKGFHIINRVLDDAPLKTIVEEIKNFQSNFYK